MVLSRLGSGYSTFQKTICGELHRLDLHQDSVMHYNGIPMKKMHEESKSEYVYNQETDKHFPYLTVGETLEFATSARTPSYRLSGVSRKQFIKETTQVAIAVLGLSHTYNTRGRF
jgi:ABC-type multidrug transport system ATPase subunit